MLGDEQIMYAGKQGPVIFVNCGVALVNSVIKFGLGLLDQGC